VLRIDAKPRDAEPSETQPKLGLIYAIDTFIPLPQFRLNRRTAAQLPNRTLLRLWLRVHRFLGLIICLAIFILVFKAV
jgi:hypothetical protein